MISRINPCCNPNDTLYVKILNQCPFYIYMQLTYRINSKRYFKQSPVFAPNKSELLTFPSGSSYVCFKILNCEFVPPQTIYVEVVRNYSSSCYKISGPSIEHIECVEIPC